MLRFVLSLAFFLAILTVFSVEGQRVFDMMDEPKTASNGPSAFYQRKTYLQPFYQAPTQLFWRRSD
ncbi:Protein CBG05630 [Caenorhabditis briggsae]|uniref:Protein CBG05630 n=1 Tax=Caenorhabditis briggsae TaxID=6238 RepID=A8X0B0_CAEBR|nr:Protein CBG05630 [Caenorhabditis briggsae]CAP26070.1 Protein CBG05630 [Caenorhabditis briggsae]